MIFIPALCKNDQRMSVCFQGVSHWSVQGCYCSSTDLVGDRRRDYLPQTSLQTGTERSFVMRYNKKNNLTLITLDLMESRGEEIIVIKKGTQQNLRWR